MGKTNKNKFKINNVDLVVGDRLDFKDINNPALILGEDVTLLLINQPVPKMNGIYKVGKVHE